MDSADCCFDTRNQQRPTLLQGLWAVTPVHALYVTILGNYMYGKKRLLRMKAGVKNSSSCTTLYILTSYMCEVEPPWEDVNQQRMGWCGALAHEERHWNNSWTLQAPAGNRVKMCAHVLVSWPQNNQSSACTEHWKPQVSNSVQIWTKQKQYVHHNRDVKGLQKKILFNT